VRAAGEARREAATLTGQKERSLMNGKYLLVAGAFYNLAFAIFHAFFWKLFGWKEDLSSLTSLNRSVMQILNLCLMFVFIIFAYVSAFHSSELLDIKLGKALLLSITIFWLLRAVEQVIFFDLHTKISLAFFAAFLLGALLYLMPALLPR
jgi:hypothetical protein